MAKEAAALLASGPSAVISHRSAAHLWRLLDEPPPKVEVTLVGRRCRPKQGVTIRTVARFERRDGRKKRGIWLTSPARTIVDLAAEADDHELERLIAKARERRLLREGELEAALARAGRRRGVASLRAILRSEAGHAMTRSEVERRCRRLLEAAGLPQPRVNRRVAGYEVDFLWPEHRVILEVDTFMFHGHHRAFEWDRRKTMALQDAGYHVIRVTRRQLTEEPYWVIARIARALERHAPAAGSQTNVAVAAGASV
jgi:very-short-patch-repair endonuclease